MAGFLLAAWCRPSAGASPAQPLVGRVVEAGAEARTLLTFASDPGDYVGGGRSWTFTPADGTITASASPGAVTVMFNGAMFWDLRFAAPTGEAFAAGVYEGPTRQASPSTKPGMDVTGGSNGCSAVTGRFIVLEAAYAPTGDVRSLAIDFEQHCEGHAPALFGSVRINSAVSIEPRISVARAAAYEGDGEPVALGFWVSLSERSNVPVSVDYATVDQSAQDGIDYTPVSGALTFPPGATALSVDVPVLGNTVPQPDRTLLLSLSNPAGAALAFGSATGIILDDDSGRTTLTLHSDPGDGVGLGQSWTLTPLDGPITVSVALGSAMVHFNGSSWWDFDFAAPSGAALVPGIYEGAGRFGFQSPTGPGMTVSSGLGCNTLTGRFVVLEAQYAPTGEAQRLAIDFEQHCGGRAPALLGSVRFNSTVPIEPRISVAPATVYEGDGEPVSLGFWVSLSERAAAPVTVDYATVDQSAHAGTDYTPVSGTLTFAPGTTAIRVDVPVLGNTIVQPDRTLHLSLTDPSGAALAFATATGTIVDDDAARTLLAFDSEPGDFIGDGQIWTVTPFDGTVSVETASGAIRVNFKGSTWWDLTFAPPAGSTLAPGVYDGASRWMGPSATPGLDVGGDGRGCNTLTGRFVILDVQYSPTGQVQMLAVDFVQHCDGLPPALFGSIRVNSPLPAFPRETLPSVFRRHLGRG